MITLIAGLLCIYFYYTRSFKPTVPLPLSSKAGLLLMFHFIPVAVSGLWSSNVNEWMHWLQIKLPYLFFPLGFLFLPSLARKTILYIAALFIIIMSLSAILVLSNYLIHFKSINESFLRGNGIPMPFSHIRYTLMLVFSFFLCLYLLKNTDETNHKKQLKVWLASAAIFLFFVIHVFSVRSSLIALYAGLTFSIGRYIWLQKKWMTGIAMLLLLVTIPVTAYYTVPSFHNKVRFMMYDWQQFKAGNINTLNDAMRVVSIDVGWNVFKQQPILGTGSGDLRQACLEQYKRQYPQTNDASRMMPHNQWVWVLASTGLFGFLFFTMALLGPFVYGNMHLSYLAVVLYIILLTSMLVEHTLEEQIGSGFYILWTLLLLKTENDS